MIIAIIESIFGQQKCPKYRENIAIFGLEKLRNMRFVSLAVAVEIRGCDLRWQVAFAAEATSAFDAVRREPEKHCMSTVEAVAQVLPYLEADRATARCRRARGPRRDANTRARFLPPCRLCVCEGRHQLLQGMALPYSHQSHRAHQSVVRRGASGHD